MDSLPKVLSDIVKEYVDKPKTTLKERLNQPTKQWTFKPDYPCRNQRVKHNPCYYRQDKGAGELCFGCSQVKRAK